MVNPIIKICGICDSGMAEQAARAGANLIGVVFHPASQRHANIEQAAEISAATKQAGASPVAVFVDQNAETMQSICETTDIQIVQLHGEAARHYHRFIPNKFKRIFALNVTDAGELQTDKGVNYLDQDRDFILIDHVTPGQGVALNLLDFRYDLNFPLILAGGLTISNVASAVKRLQPHGVDVSSGVESSPGNKDIFLIQQFIAAARSNSHAA
jgi:phosphoribosylanthranilate isomerase